jgi:hypothetical protein
MSGGLSVSWQEYENNALWPILVETVHAMVMYPHHKAYVRDVILQEQTDISPKDLAVKLGITLGESLVILYELHKQKTDNATKNVASTGK